MRPTNPILLSIVIILSAFSLNTLGQQTSEQNDAAVPATFIDLAKKVVPSVVNIRTVSKFGAPEGSSAPK